MRVNVYAEEMTDRVEVISKTTEDGEFTGLRIYLELPVTMPSNAPDGAPTANIVNVRGPFMHRPGDDDSAAVTFWGKRDLRNVLQKAVAALDAHHAVKTQPLALRVSAALAAMAEMKAVNSLLSDNDCAVLFYDRWRDAVDGPGKSERAAPDEGAPQRAPYLDRPCGGGPHFTLGYTEDDNSQVWLCPNKECKQFGKETA